MEKTMKNEIQVFIAGIVQSLGINPASIVIEAPENAEHGDYTTNVAMTLAGHLKAPPMKIAEKIVDAIKEYQKKSPLEWLDRVEIAPPGFINLFLSEASLSTELAEVLKEKERYGRTRYTGITQFGVPKNGQKTARATSLKSTQEQNGKIPEKSPQNHSIVQPSTFTHAEKTAEKGKIALFGNKKTIMVEFAHPNTHKAFHIGHLRNITTGESVVRLLESQGYCVIRANYQGDVGMHIAKALYALLNVSPFKEEVSKVTGIKNRVEFLGKAYAAGSKAFEESEDVKKIIGDINIKIYAKDPSVYPVYRETRQWSLDYFETIYKLVGSHFDRYYFESETYETGKTYVLEGLKKGIFEKSDGAIIFPGEKYGLHNRVFVNSEGNATYEGKDMGLARLQFDEYNPEVIVHCVGPEQAGYFQVMFKALEYLFPDTKGREKHLIYGWVKLKQGKMSSRLGNVVLGEWLIDEVKKEINEVLLKNNVKGEETDNKEVSRKTRDFESETTDSQAETVAIGAIKYSFLKVSTPSEIAFDLKESVNINGDSGPYLQYTYARCKSVMRKAGIESVENIGSIRTLNPEERAIIRLIIQFPDVVSDAASRFAPNALCTYLFQLAQAFNLFYAKHSIMGATKDSVKPRLALTAATAQVIKNGLYLLGINTLERM